MKPGSLRQSKVAGLLVVACAIALCGANRPPTEREFRDKDGTRLTVLLFRVITEVDGSLVEPFRHSMAIDNVNFGLGGFETGLGVKEVAARYLSDDTRKEGWTFLLVRPGVYYLAAREPIWSNQFTYTARWKTCPRWRVEIPADTRLQYVGTFFLPGKGRFMFSGPRQLVTFDESRIEVRDDSVRAAEICGGLLPDLGPPSIQPARLLKPGETMIIETPESKKDRPPVKP